MVEKIRYLDVELEEFCVIIMEKLELVQCDYDRLKSSIMNKDGNDMDDIFFIYKVLEEGVNILFKEEMIWLVVCQLKFIQGLQVVLVCIENKIYGICCEIGKLILKERFCVVFYVILSIEVKNEGKK